MIPNRTRKVLLFSVQVVLLFMIPLSLFFADDLLAGIGWIMASVFYSALIQKGDQ